VEVAAFFSTAAMAVVRWQEPVVRILATLASTCVLVMVLIWAVWINPINRTVNSWTSESIPLNWANIRDRWHYLHAIRVAFCVIGLSAVIIASLVEEHRYLVCVALWRHISTNRQDQSEILAE
jgi:hypothetical protein